MSGKLPEGLADERKKETADGDDEIRAPPDALVVKSSHEQVTSATSMMIAAPPLSKLIHVRRQDTITINPRPNALAHSLTSSSEIKKE